MKTVDRLLNELDDIDTENICYDCNRNGCRNQHDQQIPCLCDGDCQHDDECVCQCHKWADTIRQARKQLARLHHQHQDMVGSLQDAEHFRDHWYTRYLEKTSNV